MGAAREHLSAGLASASASPDGALVGPTRSCVGCRARCAQCRMLRYQLQGARVVPVLGARPRPGGRSAYLCPRRSCFDRALQRKAFSRAFTRGSRSGRSTRGEQRSRGNFGLGEGTAADTLWADTIDLIRCEIELLDRSARNSHAHLRRRGLEQLLFELSSQPAPSDRRRSGKGGSPTHG